MTSSSSVEIPHLPGYSVRKTGASDTYGRKQTLHYVNGYALQDNLSDSTTTPEIPPIVPQSVENSVVGTTTSSLPPWVAFDRKVLRFYGYFTEDVQNNEFEDHRIRKILVNFYLEDQTMHVAEPKEENSGIPQGVFIKRHHIVKADGSAFAIADINIGQSPEVYGRTYHIVDCDGFTRSYLAELGIAVGDALPYPPQPLEVFKESRKKINSGGPPRPRDDDLTRFMEAKLGCASNILLDDKLKQYIQNNQRVLRFFCLWDDREKIYGEKRSYILHYFLEDDTIEILEVYEANSGREPFPVFLRRDQLPKVLPDLDVTQTVSKNQCYTAEDLVVGGFVNVHNRAFLIYDCDGFTKNWYKDNLGIENIKAINVAEPAQPIVKMALDPYNGFGSVEDSHQNATQLIPKPPRKDFHKLMAKEKMVLRFVSQMVDVDGNSNLSNSDKDRKFIFSYFLADDSISIFEPPTRNSGIIGGKFLERARVNKPDSNDRYIESDFFSGADVMVHKRCFRLLEADEYSLQYMEDNKEIFSNSNFDLIKSSLSKGDLTGSLSQAEFAAAFPDLNSAQVTTVFRYLDSDKTGSINADQL